MGNTGGGNSNRRTRRGGRVRAAIGRAGRAVGRVFQRRNR